MAVNGLGIILFQYADWLQQKGYGRNAILALKASSLLRLPSF
jgi:hypothetical protein